MSRGRLSTNFIYNVLGIMLPLLVTIVTTPIYLRVIGAERFGVLALMWIVLGYFGLLDLGLSRASANRLAIAKTAEETLDVFWAAFWSSLTLGVAGSVILYVVGRVWGHVFFNGAPGLASELLDALPVLCLFIPLATIGGVLIGALESKHRFLTVNAIGVSGAVLFALFPLVSALLFGATLAVIIPAAIVSRIITVFLQAWAASHALALNRMVRAKRKSVVSLLSYGGWSAISTLISTLMSSLDQVLIGVFLGAAAVAHYVVPFNVATRLTVIPSALMRALFPRLAEETEEASRELEYSALASVTIAMTTACALLIMSVGFLLKLWLGAQLAPISVPVAIILIVGIWFNALASVPFWALQARGKPEVPAKIHLYEVIPYLIVLVVGMHFFGLVGAAIAWTLRTVVDAVLIFGVSVYAKEKILALVPGGLLVLACAASALVEQDLLVAAIGIVAVIVFMIGWTYKSFPMQWNRFVPRFLSS